MIWAAISFLAGIAVGWTAARYRVVKRQSDRRDLSFELRSPVDLEPCEFSHGWEVRS